ncbi:MAG: SEL1-like repeat protein [Pasteurellaceae bacterium]|nr:SEL1-like repeat protein [Pasteurellaceae bacterium]
MYKKNSDRVDHITAPNFIALSRIYEQGLWVTKDPKQACYWYQKALQAEPKLAIQQKIKC